MQRTRSALPGLVTYAHEPEELVRLKTAYSDRRLLLLFGTVLEHLIAGGNLDDVRKFWERNQLSAALAQLRVSC